MVRYTSRIKSNLKPEKKTSNPKQMASKVLDKKGGAVDKKKIESVVKAVAPKVSAVIKKIAPLIKSRFGAALPVGGVLPGAHPMLSDETIDQLSPHVFIHMLANMDMPTYNMIQGIASNFLRVQHPMGKIIANALGGSFDFPKNLSKIAMRDVLKAQTPQQLSHALHSEWLDMLSGKLSDEELGGGLFSSLKTLVKKGVAGGKKALSALASGAAAAVRAVSAGAMGAQMIGKSVNNALMQGIEVANSLSPIIQQVFPSTEGVLKAGLGHANAAQELLSRGIDISSQVEKALAPAVSALGPLDAPIVINPATAQPTVAKVPETAEPVGAGLDAISDNTGPRFIA